MLQPLVSVILFIVLLLLKLMCLLEFASLNISVVSLLALLEHASLDVGLADAITHENKGVLMLVLFMLLQL